MAWKVVDVEAQRLCFIEAAVCGERSFCSLCAEFGISRPTGYLWLKRYREQGASGLHEASRRPLRTPRRSPAELEGQIVSLRSQHPDWGARKLGVLLGRTGIQVPVSTVHRVLRRHGLIHPLDSHSQATGSFCREAPNQLWQMDFKSPKGWNAHLGPLSVLDDHSRYAVVLEQLPSGQGTAVQQRLERAFEDCGLPEAMLMDHGQPWWNAQSAGGWTQLSVWLMRLGIRLYYSGVRHPQTQGKVERFHGALERARRRGGMARIVADQTWLDRFREEYNNVRPHEALQMDTPASHWFRSPRPYAGPADPVYPPLSELGQLNAQGFLWLEGRNWQVAGALAHQTVRIARLDHRVLIFYANTPIRELDLAGRGSTMVEPRPAKHLEL
jgi:transposase InsO family protein